MILPAETLQTLWESNRRQPGWLSRLVEDGSIPEEDEAALGDLDGRYTCFLRDLERAWRKEVRERDRATVEEVWKQEPAWAKQRRMEYLGPRICELEAALAGWAAEFRDAAAVGRDTEAYLLLDLIGPAEKERDRLSQEYGALRRHKRKGGLTEAQIERARSRPLEEIVEVGKGGFILCPLHDDRNPSMLVKDGFGYCFPCHGRLDSIGYMMKVRGLSFPQAVEVLQ